MTRLGQTQFRFRMATQAEEMELLRRLVEALERLAVNTGSIAETLVEVQHDQRDEESGD